MIMRVMMLKSVMMRVITMIWVMIMKVIYW